MPRHTDPDAFIAYSAEGHVNNEELKKIDYDYTYPYSLNLKPGTELHDALVSRICAAVDYADQYTQAWLPAKQDLDDSLRAYMPSTAAESLIKSEDKRKPINIVIPFTFAMYETMCTSLFMNYALADSFHPFKGVGPEDTIAAALLERHIAYQATRFKEIQALHTSIRDELVYGFSILVPQWRRKYFQKTLPIPNLLLDPMTGQPMLDPMTGLPAVDPINPTRTEIRDTLAYEGNCVYALDPFTLILDPTVPVQELQDAEFWGWEKIENFPSAITRENSGDPYAFNALYLQDAKMDWTGSYANASTRRNDYLQTTGPAINFTGTRPFPVRYVYFNLIPSEWKLWDSTRPTKILFAVAARRILIGMQVLDFAHNMFPGAACAPDSDGHSLFPTSRLELTLPMQNAINFEFNVDMAIQRRSFLGQWIIDQDRLHIPDVDEAEAGRFIRATRYAAGEKLSDMMIPVPLVTRDNSLVPKIVSLSDWMKYTVGAPDTLAGHIPDPKGGRISATQAEQASQNAYNRMDRILKLKSGTGMYDLSLLMGLQTQQYASKEMWLDITGQYEQQLRSEYSARGLGDPTFAQSFPFTPADISLEHDVIPTDPIVGSQNYIGTVERMMQLGLSIPPVAQTLNWIGLYQHACRISKFANIQDFMLNGPPLMATVVPDAVAAEQAQRGNLEPIEGSANAPTRMPMEGMTGMPR